MGVSFLVNFLAKVFVIGKQNPILSQRFSKESIVICAASYFIHEENVCLRNQHSTAGPVHLSTRKRICADFATRGINDAFGKDFALNGKNA